MLTAHSHFLMRRNFVRLRGLELMRGNYAWQFESNVLFAYNLHSLERRFSFDAWVTIAETFIIHEENAFSGDISWKFLGVPYGSCISFTWYCAQCMIRGACYYMQLQKQASRRIPSSYHCWIFPTQSNRDWQKPVARFDPPWKCPTVYWEHFTIWALKHRIE